MFDALNDLLSKNESLVYSDLLKNGLSRATEIAKRVSIARNKVYDALYRLESKGLVSVEKSAKVNAYIVSDPKNLLLFAQNAFQEKKSMLKNIEEDFPAMQAAYSGTGTPNPYFTYTRGRKNILQDIRSEIRNTKDYVFIFARRMTFFEEYSLESAYSMLVKKGVDVRIITIDEPNARRIVKRMHAQAIFVPENIIPARTMIIKDGLFAISLYGKHEGIRIKTESKELVEAFKSLFMMVWAISERKK